MKYTLLIIASIIAAYSSSLGQKLHNPAEIFKIMEKSPVTYELNELEWEIPIPDRTDNLNYNHSYRIVNG